MKRDMEEAFRAELAAAREQHGGAAVGCWRALCCCWPRARGGGGGGGAGDASVSELVARPAVQPAYDEGIMLHPTTADL